VPPKFGSTEAYLSRKVKENEYLLFAFQIDSLDQDLFFEDADAWNVELKELSNALGDFLSIDSCEDSQSLVHTPSHILDYEL
jgi:hypothetical protein